MLAQPVMYRHDDVSMHRTMSDEHATMHAYVHHLLLSVCIAFYSNFVIREKTRLAISPHFSLAKAV